jgi:flagellar basal-body rod protein FlgB
MVNGALTTLAGVGIFCRGGNAPLTDAGDPDCMVLDDIPLFGLLKGRLGYLNQRQKLISQNVANADTPGYAAKDLKPFTFEGAMKAARQPQGFGPVATNPMHLPGTARAVTVWNSNTAPDSETTLDGNSVVLEEQMLKMAEARQGYDAAVGFYQKSLGFLRTAARRPGM